MKLTCKLSNIIVSYTWFYHITLLTMTTLAHSDAQDAAMKSTPLPYTVTDLETFDFGNKIEGVPEIGRSVSVLELANYVNDREYSRQGPDTVVRIWEYTLGYNYNANLDSETRLMINGKVVPQIWDTAWNSIVFYPERVIVKTSKGIVVNPHTLSVDKDGELDRRTFDVTKDVRDHVTNEHTVAFIDNGEIYTQPIDKSAEPTKNTNSMRYRR